MARPGRSDARSPGPLPPAPGVPATGDDQPPHATLDEAARDPGEDLLDQRPGPLTAELLLDFGDALRRRGRAEEDRLLAKLVGRPIQRIFRDVLSGGGGERVDDKG